MSDPRTGASSAAASAASAASASCARAVGGGPLTLALTLPRLFLFALARTLARLGRLFPTACHKPLRLQLLLHFGEVTLGLLFLRLRQGLRLGEIAHLRRRAGFVRREFLFLLAAARLLGTLGRGIGFFARPRFGFPARLLLG